MKRWSKCKETVRPVQLVVIRQAYHPPTIHEQYSSIHVGTSSARHVEYRSSHILNKQFNFMKIFNLRGHNVLPLQFPLAWGEQHLRELQDRVFDQVWEEWSWLQSSHPISNTDVIWGLKSHYSPVGHTPGASTLLLIPQGASRFAISLPKCVQALFERV